MACKINVMWFISFSITYVFIPLGVFFSGIISSNLTFGFVLPSQVYVGSLVDLHLLLQVMINHKTWLDQPLFHIFIQLHSLLQNHPHNVKFLFWVACTLLNWFENQFLLSTLPHGQSKVSHTMASLQSVVPLFSLTSWFFSITLVGNAFLVSFSYIPTLVACGVSIIGYNWLAQSTNKWSILNHSTKLIRRFQ